MTAREEGFGEVRADEARVADDEKPQAAVAFRAFRAPVATANMTIPVADTVAHARLAYNEGASFGTLGPRTSVTRRRPEPRR